MQSLGKSVPVVRCPVPAEHDNSVWWCGNCGLSGQALELNGWGLPVLEHQADLDRACARRVLVSLPTRAIFRLVLSV
jgi:uncharacterized protein (UPF0212 family)